MTKSIGGDVIEPAARPDLLAPGTVVRPEWIPSNVWRNMPWPAQWRAARRGAPARRSEPEVPEPLDTHAADERRHKGPIATQPHGTYAAARRHERRGEKPCQACTEARRAYTRTNPEARIRRSAEDIDPILIDRFIRDEAPWSQLTVTERVIAARRLDIAGVSRRIIKQRTHLNTAALRHAFASTDLSTAGIDSAAGEPDDARRAS